MTGYAFLSPSPKECVTSPDWSNPPYGLWVLFYLCGHVNRAAARFCVSMPLRALGTFLRDRAGGRGDFAASFNALTGSGYFSTLPFAQICPALALFLTSPALKWLGNGLFACFYVFSSNSRPFSHFASIAMCSKTPLMLAKTGKIGSKMAPNSRFSAHFAAFCEHRSSGLTPLNARKRLCECVRHHNST